MLHATAQNFYEELLIANSVAGSRHPRIMRATEEALGWDEVRQYLDGLDLTAQTFNCDRARELLRAVVNGYRPADRVEDLVWQQRELKVRPGIESGKVTELGGRRSEKLN